MSSLTSVERIMRYLSTLAIPMSPNTDPKVRRLTPVLPLQGGTIRGSINLPAQSLYPAIPTLYNLFKSAGVQKVIWYCCRFRIGVPKTSNVLSRDAN